MKLSKLCPPKKQSILRPLPPHTLGVLFGVVRFGLTQEAFEGHMQMPIMQFIIHLIILQLMGSRVCVLGARSPSDCANSQ